LKSECGDKLVMKLKEIEPAQHSFLLPEMGLALPHTGGVRDL
jgi:hypothetical protein